MAHHKRGRPKNRRAGCLMCKPWKANGVKKRGDVSSPPMMDLGRTWKQEWRSWLDEREQLADLVEVGEEGVSAAVSVVDAPVPVAVAGPGGVVFLDTAEPAH